MQILEMCSLSLVNITFDPNCANKNRKIFQIFPIKWVILIMVIQFLFTIETLKMFNNLFFALVIVVVGCAHAFPQDELVANCKI